MTVHIRPPHRPEPSDPLARRVLEWADVIFYIFWLVLSAVLLVAVVI